MQVLNVANSHWITISTIGCEDSTVNVYDSLHGYLTSRTQRLVADLVQCRNRAIKLQYCDVQWQSGANDCGLFALAFATSLCSGQNPATTSYNEGQMRSYLLDGLVSGDIQPFPTRGPRRKIQRPTIKLIPVFCVCRLTDTGTQMVQCSACEDWFHTACISIPKRYLTSTIQWKCPSCK